MMETDDFIISTKAQSYTCAALPERNFENEQGKTCGLAVMSKKVNYSYSKLDLDSAQGR